MDLNMEPEILLSSWLILEVTDKFYLHLEMELSTAFVFQSRISMWQRALLYNFEKFNE